MAKSTTRKESGNPFRPNFYGMITNVLLGALDKGQFLLGFAGLTMLIIIFKLSSQDLKELVTQLGKAFLRFDLVGWGLAVLMAGIWFYTSKKAKETNEIEINRLNKELETLQKKHIRPGI